MKSFVINQTNEEFPIGMMQKFALLNRFVQTSEEDIHISFKNAHYISPAVALVILALRDELKKKNRTLFFSTKELIDNPAALDFFVRSGLTEAIDKRSQAVIAPLLKKNKQHTPDKQYFAHVINLSELSELESQQANLFLIKESVNAVKAIGSSDADFCNILICKIIELLNNTLSHSFSQNAYIMAALAEDESCIIAVYDRGIGIPGAYKRFAKSNDLPSKTSPEAIKWAMQRGTSTLQVRGAVPRGAGLFTMKELADNCNGNIIIASLDGLYIYKNQHEISYNVPFVLPGTMFMMKIPADFRL